VTSTVTPGEKISVSIGSGGNASNAPGGGKMGGAYGSDTQVNHGSEFNSSKISVAYGGGTVMYDSSSQSQIFTSNRDYTFTRNGGSGGGAGANKYYYGEQGFSNYGYPTYAGYDGKGDRSDAYSTSFYGNTGQGTTTRYFGESNGTLYASGGGGGGYNFWSNGTNYTFLDYHFNAYGANGGYKYTGMFSSANIYYSADSANSNTGNGGGGAAMGEYDYIDECGGSGGSGIAIIRWGKK
jgi:hypothetical protein